MANLNWQADFEQALAEEDRSDPTADNVFQNRHLATWAVGTGILSIFIGIGAAYVAKNGDRHFSRDDLVWFESVAWLCWIGAAVEIPLGLCGIFLLRRKPPAPSPFQNAQRASGPPIGW